MQALTTAPSVQVRVGWPALRDVGLDSFAWVHAHELPGGRPLCVPNRNYHGALVYERTDGQRPLLFVLALHTHEQVFRLRQQVSSARPRCPPPSMRVLSTAPAVHAMPPKHASAHHGALCARRCPRSGCCA